MSSRAVTVAAVTAAGGLLAYCLFFRKKKADNSEIVALIEEERVTDKVAEIKADKVAEAEADKVAETPTPKLDNEIEERSGSKEEERRGKESLMQWIDRQLEEAERKTAGSPWPEIPGEDESETLSSDHVLPDQSAVGREAEVDLPEIRGTGFKDGDKAYDQDDSSMVELVQVSDDVIDEQSGLNISIAPESDMSSEFPEAGVDSNQNEFLSDSEIELLKEPRTASHNNEERRLLEESESEEESFESGEVTTTDLQNEQDKNSKQAEDELITLRPAWQTKLSK